MLTFLIWLASAVALAGSGQKILDKQVSAAAHRCLCRCESMGYSDVDVDVASIVPGSRIAKRWPFFGGPIVCLVRGDLEPERHFDQLRWAYHDAADLKVNGRHP